MSTHPHHGTWARGARTLPAREERCGLCGRPAWPPWPAALAPALPLTVARLLWMSLRAVLTSPDLASGSYSRGWRVESRMSYGIDFFLPRCNISLRFFMYPIDTVHGLSAVNSHKLGPLPIRYGTYLGGLGDFHPKSFPLFIKWSWLEHTREGLLVFPENIA